MTSPLLPPPLEQMSSSTRTDRRKLKHDRIRQEICDAAARAFAESGYDGATMAQIAGEAGFAAPTLYSYFKGKKEIFEALTDRVKTELFSFFDEPVPAGITLEQHLELILQRQLQWVSERTAELQCISTENQDVTMARTVVEEFQRKAIAVFEQHPDSRILEGLSHARAAFLFWLINHGYHNSRFKMGLTESAVDARELLAVFKGACRGVVEYDNAE